MAVADEGAITDVTREVSSPATRGSWGDSMRARKFKGEKCKHKSLVAKAEGPESNRGTDLKGGGGSSGLSSSILVAVSRQVDVEKA